MAITYKNFVTPNFGAANQLFANSAAQLRNVGSGINSLHDMAVAQQLRQEQEAKQAQQAQVLGQLAGAKTQDQVAGILQSMGNIGDPTIVSGFANTQSNLLRNMRNDVVNNANTKASTSKITTETSQIIPDAVMGRAEKATNMAHIIKQTEYIPKEFAIKKTHYNTVDGNDTTRVNNQADQFNKTLAFKNKQLAQQARLARYKATHSGGGGGKGGATTKLTIGQRVTYAQNKVKSGDWTTEMGKQFVQNGITKPGDIPKLADIRIGKKKEVSVADNTLNMLSKSDKLTPDGASIISNAKNWKVGTTVYDANGIPRKIDGTLRSLIAGVAAEGVRNEDDLPTVKAKMERTALAYFDKNKNNVDTSKLSKSKKLLEDTLEQAKNYGKSKNKKVVAPEPDVIKLHKPSSYINGYKMPSSKELEYYRNLAR